MFLLKDVMLPCNESFRMCQSNKVTNQNRDERRQFITVNGWMAMTWQDQLMVWNASEYDGVDTIKVSKKSIWTPDITLYNNVDTGFERLKNTVPLSITSDGTVSMATPAIYTAFCKMNVKYFPFDKQICYFKHGSWAYGSHHVDVEALQGEEANQDYFNENGVWGLDFVSFKKNIIKYDCCPHPFTDITMTIGLSRRSEFYVGNVLAPCVLLSFLAAFVFYLPPECGEKISFSITTLLAIVLFQQLIAESLPPSDETPYIASFFTLIISLGCFSVVATSVILKFHFGQHIKPVNEFIHKVFIRGLGSILGVYKDLDSYTPPPCFKRVDHVSPFPVISEDKQKNKTLSPALQASSEFKELMKDIRKFNQHIEEQKKEEELTKTWTDLASVFDRVMLILCMLIVLCASAIIMIKLIVK
ncbi:neuronal acetylcholine receptor subunit alpha-9-like isoform X2 [Anneissia japonica]|uniref:neuronal acetylcholine receptor subunit alpha-9-like isoform X2 n=1 Tax=Anneissia japonica TaxID=1529436 RepID=UPI001425A011|nr:neuronal acetylcholine receptor subunit alpha-9-like isoform X2 [Anneissia japonica]XP_033102370.1 neuronal acetylcholine receptor subunit alpha-9-like isoform X2 [Anneissia japonica]